MVEEFERENDDPDLRGAQLRKMLLQKGTDGGRVDRMENGRHLEKGAGGLREAVEVAGLVEKADGERGGMAGVPALLRRSSEQCRGITMLRGRFHVPLTHILSIFTRVLHGSKHHPR